MVPNETKQAYDAIAAEYVRNIYDELQYKPLDRELLNRFAAHIPAGGVVCDMGRGPGHVARYLHERGLQVCGIDLSPEMISQARRLNRGSEFREDDMFALDIRNESCSGIA